MQRWETCTSCLSSQCHPNSESTAELSLALENSKTQKKTYQDYFYLTTVLSACLGVCMYRGVRLPGTKMAETSGTLGVTVEQEVKRSFSTTPTYTVCWCKRSASQSRLSISYQLAYTVKLGCSSVRNVLVLPWRSQGCPHLVMGLRTSLRKTVLTDPLWLIYCRVLNISVLFSTLCKNFIINRALKCRIHATFFLLRAAMVTSSSRTTGDSRSLWPLKHKKTRAQKDK